MHERNAGTVFHRYCRLEPPSDLHFPPVEDSLCLRVYFEPRYKKSHRQSPGKKRVVGKPIARKGASLQYLRLLQKSKQTSSRQKKHTSQRLCPALPAATSWIAYG